MACNYNRIIPLCLATIGTLVLVFVPVYYIYTIVYPHSEPLYGRFDLPYENEYVQVVNASNRVVVSVRKSKGSAEFSLTIELESLGNFVSLTASDRNSFHIVGDDRAIIFRHLSYGTSEFYGYHVYHGSNWKQVESYTACFDLRPQQWSWFGGPSQARQYWPVEKLQLRDYAYLPKEKDHCAVAERYWLNSAGAFIYVDENVPLFIDQNQNASQLCLTSKNEPPYSLFLRDAFLSYYIGVGGDAKIAHQYAFRTGLIRAPSNYADEQMVKYPIWTTRARYKTNINETAVIQLADEIERHGFNGSHIEIDDNWEQCYGSLTFDVGKFPNIRNLTNLLKTKGLRTTLWAHPFVNKACHSSYTDGLDNGYFVTDENGSDATQWWHSAQGEAAHIDFTDKRAANWFSMRLELLQRNSGINSFNFDAGETDWLPRKSNLKLDEYNVESPIALTNDYIHTVIKFGRMVTVRSAHSTQNQPFYLRMMDLDSSWSWDNGLPNLVTKLLHLNMVGYGFILPDIIGGHGTDGERPDKELFIRWLQATVFMASQQFSYTPWDYDNETIAICKKFTALHEQYASEIMLQFGRFILGEQPVNLPIWWLEPTDRTAHQINDEYLLGDRILVAPVLQRGQISRHIYLTSGRWIDGNTDETIDGPQWLMDYPAPLDTLPYFLLDSFNFN